MEIYIFVEKHENTFKTIKAYKNPKDLFMDNIMVFDEPPGSSYLEFCKINANEYNPSIETNKYIIYKTKIN